MKIEYNAAAQRCYLRLQISIYLSSIQVENSCFGRVSRAARTLRRHHTLAVALIFIHQWVMNAKNRIKVEPFFLPDASDRSSSRRCAEPRNVYSITNTRIRPISVSIGRPRRLLICARSEKPAKSGEQNDRKQRTYYRETLMEFNFANAYTREIDIRIFIRFSLITLARFR